MSSTPAPADLDVFDFASHQEAVAALLISFGLDATHTYELAPGGLSFTIRTPTGRVKTLAWGAGAAVMADGIKKAVAGHATKAKAPGLPKILKLPKTAKPL